MTMKLEDTVRLELQELTDEMLDRALTPDQWKRMNEILSLEGAAAFYASYVGMHADLRWKHRGSELGEFVPEIRHQQRTSNRSVTSRYALAMLATAASLLLVFGTIQFQKINAPRDNGPVKDQLANPAQVPKQRLAGSTLRPVGNQFVTWAFGDTDAILTTTGEILPTDIVVDILGEPIKVRKIQASWDLDKNRQGQLLLKSIVVDGKPWNDDAALKLEAAGAVRFNLGSRQYNLFRDAT